MSRKAFARSAVGGTLAAALAACGGGGGDSSPPVVLNPPVISAQPTAQSVLTDASATFSVTATGAGLSYQWRRNGTAIAGATSASYTTPAASYADQGAQYSVTVTNADGSVTSSAAALSLVASASQQAFESVALAPSDGSYLFRWNLNLSGPQASGTNYAYSESSVLAQSPLTAGPQTNAQSAPANLATSLALTSTGPTRILKNGSILVVPTLQASNRISYVGSDVRVDSLAADNTTVAYSQLRSDYTSASLTGLVSATPAEFAQWFNSFSELDQDVLVAHHHLASQTPGRRDVVGLGVGDLLGRDLAGVAQHGLFLFGQRRANGRLPLSTVTCTRQDPHSPFWHSKCSEILFFCATDSSVFVSPATAYTVTSLAGWVK
jgi:hypothetical protein